MLEKVPLFSNLSTHEIAKLEAISQERSVPKNTMVISEGDDTDCLYVVIKGKAHAFRNDESSRQLIVNSFGPYDYFGEMSFFDSNVRCATVITKVKCTLLILPRKRFFNFASHPKAFQPLDILNDPLHWHNAATTFFANLLVRRLDSPCTSCSGAG